MKTLESLESIIAEHPFCKGLDPRYVELLTGCASNVRFPAGERLFRTGEPADDFYILRHGDVAIEIREAARGTVTVETIHEGDVLGWSWLVPPYRWSFDARAITLVRAIAFDGACLRGKCEENHDLGYEVLKRVTQVVSDRLAATRLQLLDLYGNKP
ncbi:MAG: cyclic nucleotide-binding domain-containing protein [Myxococcales bacterium]|nr:cyclic nucleotide-binding domain-containing protein [Myxococcales bacterium]